MLSLRVGSNTRTEAKPHEQEWYLYKHIETEQHELAHEYAEPGSILPALSVKCRAARRPAYFIWNIFLVTVSVITLS
ncbi:unnamed protein product [Protopolystoma xenopodis]|uniref:Uncharacterized protein n=1 Tax=Protopolystoma xenopodis TaxID=117903 RepID=A0A448WJ06_9PLAT|nr:unnamed protein product [Protopolystoma xenopodis]